MQAPWQSFNESAWTQRIDVRSFIQKNYTPYEGGDEFLCGPSQKTQKLWDKCLLLLKEELTKGVMDIDRDRISGIDAFPSGYIDRDNEVIVGLQTDSPLKRMINPFGGLATAKNACQSYGYVFPEWVEGVFKHRKTHNQGVFGAYTDTMRRARSSGLLTGLPDAYGRGRIIGDYRRVALYGTDRLIEDKKRDAYHYTHPMTGDLVLAREELGDQIKALEDMQSMAAVYGLDISKPASSAFEAIQWVYMAYLAGVKENNGAAMSLGRVSSFLDIYIERDLIAGQITEVDAQELIDQLVIKLRFVRHLRTPEYNQLFAGDPNWITESLGGMGTDGRTLVTKTTFRFLNTLRNLGPSPEPNMTILWSVRLPEAFKDYCGLLSIETAALQYENDDLMRPIYSDDYAIACCVSAMTLGHQMQFFGARCNLAKTLLYAINGGIDEITGAQVIKGLKPITEDVLDYEIVWARMTKVIEKVATLYVDTMNVIHTMHDKYAYEASLMALHHSKVERLMAFGVAGLSIVADSLSAIRYGRVEVVREHGLAVDFKVTGNFPCFGNDDDRVDDIAISVLEKFSHELKKNPAYRGAKHTLSVLTITSNLVYGQKTGATPDGRAKGMAFAPGANPMHGRELSGALASLRSVAKLPYQRVCEDGISNTFSIVPEALGKESAHRLTNLKALLDGYFDQGGHHLNVNVLCVDTLKEAMEHPEKHPNLTVRVSGYAVHFNRLTREQQLEVLHRTYHGAF